MESLFICYFMTLILILIFLYIGYEIKCLIKNNLAKHYFGRRCNSPDMDDWWPESTDPNYWDDEKSYLKYNKKYNKINENDLRAIWVKHKQTLKHYYY